MKRSAPATNALLELFPTSAGCKRARVLSSSETIPTNSFINRTGSSIIKGIGEFNKPSIWATSSIFHVLDDLNDDINDDSPYQKFPSIEWLHEDSNDAISNEANRDNKIAFNRRIEDIRATLFDERKDCKKLKKNRSSGLLRSKRMNNLCLLGSDIEPLLENQCSM